MNKLMRFVAKSIVCSSCYNHIWNIDKPLSMCYINFIRSLLGV